MKLIQSTAILLSGILFPHAAFAYLDPGAGSFILQMLIAGIMGALFTIKLYWYRLKAFIARLFGKQVDSGYDRYENYGSDDDQAD